MVDTDCDEPGDICCPAQFICEPPSDTNLLACGETKLSVVLASYHGWVVGATTAFELLSRSPSRSLISAVVVPPPVLPQLDYRFPLSIRG